MPSKKSSFRYEDRYDVLYQKYDETVEVTTLQQQLMQNEADVNDYQSQNKKS